MAPVCAKQMLLTEYGANPWLANHKGKTPQQAVGGTRRHCKDVFKVSSHHPQIEPSLLRVEMPCDSRCAS
jgi:hypothetical protein